MRFSGISVRAGGAGGLLAVMLLLLAGCDARQSGEAAPPPAADTGAAAPGDGGEAASPEGGAATGDADIAEAETQADDEADIEPLPDDLETFEGPAMMSEDKFLAAYAQLDGVTVLDSGVMYRVLEEGPGGASPTLDDWVKTRYRGTLMNGDVFDETGEGRTAAFRVGSVIRGWQEILPLMSEGDRWEVAIPSLMAYGETGTDDGAIGPHQPLVFEITLVEVMENQ